MILNSKGIVIIWFWPTWVESCYVLSLTGQTIAVGFKTKHFCSSLSIRDIINNAESILYYIFVIIISIV